jgi:parallel beta-helix repeat protein
MRSGRSSIWGALALGIAVVSAPSVAAAAAFVLTSGDSIQDAVDAASDGDIIKLTAGDYYGPDGATDAVLITKRIKLIAWLGKNEVARVLPGAGNQNGIVIRGTPSDLVERVQIKGVTVEGFPNHGIWLEYADGFKLRNNTSANNLHNGIFPTLSANGLVKNNVSYGALDAGLWVEASENIRVIGNEIYNNPTGLEITVSKRVLAKANDIHDNTVGVGLYHPNGASLPPLGDDGDWEIIGNDIYDNNFPNPVPPGGLVGLLPAGVGILTIGVDKVTILGNQVTGNDLNGVGVLDWCLVNDCDADPPIVEDQVENIVVMRNNITGNAGDPFGNGNDDPRYDGTPLGVFAQDIFYGTLGAGTGNCFAKNTFDTFLAIPGPDLPGC